MCTIMGLRPYGTDAFLRFQLRNKLRVLQSDDKDILWEGIDALNKRELQLACQERGMPAVGLDTEEYRAQMRQWLDLSANKQIPPALLIMSRAFITEAKPKGATGTRMVAKKDAKETEEEMDAAAAAVIAGAISTMDHEVLTEVVVEEATVTSKDEAIMLLEHKLESVETQAEMIQEEREDLEMVKKKREQKMDEERKVKDAERKRAEMVAAVEVAMAPPVLPVAPHDGADELLTDAEADARAYDSGDSASGMVQQAQQQQNQHARWREQQERRRLQETEGAVAESKAAAAAKAKLPRVPVSTATPYGDVEHLTENTGGLCREDEAMKELGLYDEPAGTAASSEGAVAAEEEEQTAEEKQPKEEPKQLTSADLEALDMLSGADMIAAEKEKLKQMKEQREALNVEFMLENGR
jgi:hypothetical protein